MDISRTLTLGWPGSRWRMNAEDYKQLEWLDDSKPKPTLKQIEAKWEEIKDIPEPLSEVDELKNRVTELEAMLVKTDAVAEDLKAVLIEKDVIKEADLEAVKAG